MRLATLLIICAIALSVGTPAAAEPCAPGFHSPDGNAPCDPCVAGSVAPLFGSTACSDCPAGTFAALPGQAACNVCPDGSIAPAIGSAACQQCPSGLTSDATHTVCVPIATPARPWSWGKLKLIYR